MAVPLPGLHPKISRQALGWSAVLGSAFFFYLATLIIRWSVPYAAIDSAYFVFARFLLGFLVVATTMLLQRQQVRARSYHFLVGRAVANTAAVYCFYKAVEVGSVAQANILNMTYPLFVALFSWFFLRTQRDITSFVIVTVALIGIWMVLAPGDMSLGAGGAWGLASGITAAAAIVYLNLSRRFHDSQTILLYMFGLGAIFMLVFFHSSVFLPNSTEFLFLLACSVAGVLGQYLLTYGFLYVTAIEGSILSSSRILMAALLGPLLVADPALTVTGWIGAFLLFSANASLALRKH
ncbi:MAG: EamA family transporter [Pelovirga sp.]